MLDKTVARLWRMLGWRDFGSWNKNPGRTGTCFVKTSSLEGGRKLREEDGVSHLQAEELEKVRHFNEEVRKDS